MRLEAFLELAAPILASIVAAAVQFHLAGSVTLTTFLWAVGSLLGVSVLEFILVSRLKMGSIGTSVDRFSELFTAHSERTAKNAIDLVYFGGTHQLWNGLEHWIDQTQKYVKDAVGKNNFSKRARSEFMAHLAGTLTKFLTRPGVKLSAETRVRIYESAVLEAVQSNRQVSLLRFEPKFLAPETQWSAHFRTLMVAIAKKKIPCNFVVCTSFDDLKRTENLDRADRLVSFFSAADGDSVNLYWCNRQRLLDEGILDDTVNQFHFIILVGQSAFATTADVEMCNIVVMSKSGESFEQHPIETFISDQADECRSLCSNINQILAHHARDPNSAAAMILDSATIQKIRAASGPVFSPLDGRIAGVAGVQPSALSEPALPALGHETGAN